MELKVLSASNLVRHEVRLFMMYFSVLSELQW